MSEMSFDELKEALKFVRRLLLTIIVDRSGERLKELEPLLRETTNDIDENIAKMLRSNSNVEEQTQAAVREIKDIWGAFRKTRDLEIIPALHKGRFDAAIKLASGIQEERFRQFISIAELVNFNNSLEVMLEQKTKAIRESLFDFARLFADLIELFDSRLGGHCKRVSRMSKNLAVKVGLEGSEVSLVEAASNLHTIGLIGVPRVIFHKDEKELTEKEKKLLQNNPVLSQELLSHIDTLKQAGLLIRSHMEKYDGTGYPDGLKEDEIPTGSRILAVCKLYDMARHRQIDPLDRDSAIEFLQSKSEVMLDPHLVDSFAEMITEEIISEDGSLLIGKIRARSRHKKTTVMDGTIRKVPLAEISSGMVLAVDLVTVKGTLIITKGTLLTTDFIDKIFEINQVTPVVTAAMINT